MKVLLANGKTSWRKSGLLILGATFLSIALVMCFFINPPYVLQQYLFERCCDCGRFEQGYLPAFIVCKVIRNCAPSSPKWLVQSVFCRPLFLKTGKSYPSFPPLLADSDETGIYDIGPGVLLRLDFKEDNCTRVSTCEKQFDYEQWKMRQIEKYAMGRTESEIESAIGRNYGRRHFPSVRYFVGTQWHDTPPSDGWVYYIGDDQIALTMEKGRCINAGAMFIFY